MSGNRQSKFCVEKAKTSTYRNFFSEKTIAKIKRDISKLQKKDKETKTDISCGICGSKFEYLQHLTSHELSNQCFRFCLDCNTIVRGKISWLKHQLKHSSFKTQTTSMEQPKQKNRYLCSYCQVPFFREHARDNHEKFKHCFVCKRFFNNRKTLIQHHFLNHRDEMWFCTICACYQTRKKFEATVHEKEHGCDLCTQRYFKTSEQKKIHWLKHHDAEQILQATNEQAINEAASPVRSKTSSPPSKTTYTWQVYDVSQKEDGTWEVLINEKLDPRKGE